MMNEYHFFTFSTNTGNSVMMKIKKYITNDN